MRLVPVFCLFLAVTASADDAVVAVATNFNTVVNELKTQFESTTGHQISIASSSTGKLYAQIVNGAPYDVFLAADQARPLLLEESGLGVPGTRFTYATGRLALLVNDRNQILDDLQTTLRQAPIRKFAIANPALAPYGAAAREALQSLGAWDALSARIVMGENIGQAYTLVATGNAEAGIVALSTVLTADPPRAGDYLEIPPELHAPIRQDAILLAHGAANDAARQFVEFLRNDAVARGRIAAFGYGERE